MSNFLLKNLASYISARYSGAIVSNLRFLTSGFESDVYTFNLQFSDTAPKDYILRLFNGEGADQRIIRETSGLPSLQQAGILVPELLLFDTDSQILGKPFEIIEKLDGQALWSVLTATDLRQVPPLLDRFGKLLSQLHQLDWRSFTSRADEYDQDPALILDEIILHYRSAYTKYDIKSFIQVVDWLEAHKHEISARPTVVHQDFHGNNVFLCSDNRLFVIDWTQLGVSDYRMDISWTLMIMGDFGKEEWAKQILEAYVTSSKVAVEDLDYFNTIVCMKMLGGLIIPFVTNPENLSLRQGIIEGMKKEPLIYRSLARRIEKITDVPIPELEIMLNEA
jgi:aminoglycoside phosphotransferase (APT) family kinase protein